MIQDRLTLNFEIAERLRRARSAADLSLAQLADRTDGRISVSTISNYERGQRRVGIEEARLLANMGGVGIRPAIGRVGDRGSTAPTFGRRQCKVQTRDRCPPLNSC